MCSFPVPGHRKNNHSVGYNDQKMNGLKATDKKSDKPTADHLTHSYSSPATQGKTRLLHDIIGGTQRNHTLSNGIVKSLTKTVEKQNKVKYLTTCKRLIDVFWSIITSFSTGMAWVKYDVIGHKKSRPHGPASSQSWKLMHFFCSLISLRNKYIN